VCSVRVVTEPIPQPGEPEVDLLAPVSSRWVWWIAAAILIGATVSCVVLLICLMVAGGGSNNGV
jgi:uncharacterized protein involved in exopolysaccharide biosynthesis